MANANLRPILIVMMLFLAYLLWVEWQQDYGPQPAAPVSAPAPAPVPVPADGAVPSMADAADLPAMSAAPDAAMPALAGSSEAAAAAQPAAARTLITVRTDVLELRIDPLGGTVVDSQLLSYPVELSTPEDKVHLLNDRAGRYHVAQSGLLSTDAAPNHTTAFTFERDDYELAAGQDTLVVPLRWTDSDGRTVVKRFQFKRGAYDIAVSFDIKNAAGSPWVVSRYDQLQKAPPGDEGGAGFNNPERYSFDGLGFYSPADGLEKLDFDEASSDAYDLTTSEGWLAMIQHYFFVAWIPPQAEQAKFTSTLVNSASGPRAIARVVAPPVSVAPGAEQQIDSTLYVGPKLQDELEAIAPGLDLTVNYGIFTVFSAPLFWLLSKIHDVVGNWGWAIVLLTVLIKLAFFKLTEAQYRSMARMRKLQPRMEKLKERYGDDRQALSQAMMKMYKEEKVNPLGGCLPILVQIPIFIALYWVLLESVELRQAPFILWIDNLSVRDPYFILPLLNAVFMIATQRLTPMVGMDPLQRKMMQAMPIVFSVMFAFFPAGLVLYWATNAGLSLAQQWYITRKIEREA